MPEAIAIELIRTDGGTQIRDCKTQQTKIAEYATAMAEGAEFPPLTVFWDGEHYWLADGFHRLGAYNIVMQGLELPGLDIDCEVIEGSQREAILFACGANAGHGIQRTIADKRNAVDTMLLNPLVALNDDGTPWSSAKIGRICRVSHTFVDKRKADLKASGALTCNVGGEVAYTTKHGTNSTMNTANMGGKSEPPEAEVAADAPAKPAETPTKPAETPAKPATTETPAKTNVVEFTNKWDYLYDRMKEIEAAIGALPEPHVAAANFPPSLAHSISVERCQQTVRWFQEFARLWAARQPELRSHQQYDIEDDLNAASR